jgi:hypothetical protein
MKRPFVPLLLVPVLLASAAAPAPAEAGPLAEPILAPNQTTVEVQVFTGTRVPALPPAASAAEWTATAARLRTVVRAPDYRVAATPAGTARAEGAEVSRWRLRMNGDWTVPVVELAPPNARATVLLLADGGRAAAGPRVRELLAAGNRVVAVDPFYFGESAIAGQPGLFAILVAALGERPLGIQAGQVAAVARWLAGPRGLGPVGIVTEGPRTGLIGLVAAALEPDAVAGLVQREAMGSLREVITGNLTVMDRPEQFCFGLLREFDVPQLQALVAPRPVTRR